MKSQLSQQATKFLRAMGDNEAIAKHFNVTAQKVKGWMAFGKFPQFVFEEMFTEAQNQATSPEVEQEVIEAIDAPAPAHHIKSEGPLEEIKAMLLDLHNRTIQIEERFNSAESPESAENGVGARVPHSGVRPPSGLSNPMQAAGIVNPGLPAGARKVGVGTGIAPSRAEAHASTQGPRGNPAGPAKARNQIKKGDPGWNAGWNDPKPRVQMVPVQVAAWPVSR